jgi:tape measure domain-containing protein
MELPQLVVELVGDYSKLMEDIKKARVEAIKQAQFLEKDLNLTIGVDDRSLKKLNEHFDLKVTHFKQTQSFFKNNPLKVFVDDGELTNLNKELASLTKGSNGRARVRVDVEVNKEKANLVINNNNNSREIVGQLKSVEKAVMDSAKLSLGRSLGTGLTEEFGRTIGKNLMSGFKKNLGLDVAGATQSFTRAVSKPLSKVTPESIQKFEDDIVSALEDAFVFKNQAQAQEKFKAAFQPIVDEIQEIAYTAAGQVLKVGAQPLRIRKRVLLAQSAQDAAKMSENVNVADNEDIKKAKSISLITGGIDFQKGGRNTFFAENLVKRILPGSYSVPVTNPYSNDKNNLGQIYQFRSNLSSGTVVGADGVERPASEPMPFDMLLHTNLEKGYNPDSVKMAAEAMAYRKKYPDKPIQLAGTSGGSYIVEEAIAILERAGITNVKGLGLTAPVNNLMTTASQKNYQSLVGEFDPLNVVMFGGKNVADKEHPVYKATLKVMPYGMPGLMEESPLMSLIPGAGKGHALLPFLTKPMVNEQIQSFLGDAIDPVSPSLSKGIKSEPNLHFFKSQLDEKDSLVRTLKAVLGDGSTLRQIEKAGFNGAEGYTFAVPQKPEWRRGEYDFSCMMGNLPNARQIGKDIKPEFDEYTAFLEEMRAGIVEFLDSGAKTKQSLAKTLEKAVKFYPELKTLQTRVLETLGEQARLTDLNKNPKKDTRTAREKYTDNQRLARINAQFPQGQEYLKDFKNREKDKDLSPEARAGLESARNIAAQFNKSFATLQTLTKSGNLDEAANMAAAIKQMSVKAREEIKLIIKTLGESNGIGSTRLGSQLGNTLSQISRVQNTTDRIVNVNKLNLPSVGENVGKGITEGLDSSLKDLRTSSEKLAETVINTVEEKLEIKSPSRWAIRTGRNIGNAMGVGADESLNNAKKIITSRVDEIRKGAENGLVLPSGYNKLPHINKGSLANLPINGLLQPSSGVDLTRLNSPRTTSVFSAPTGEFSKLYNPNISTEELRKTFAKQISKNLSSVVSTDEINRSLGLSPVILPDSYAKYKKQNNVSPIITSSSQLNPYSGSIPLANPLKPYQGLILPNNNNSNNGNNLILPGQRSGSGLPLILPPEKQPHVVRLTEAQESFKNMLLSAGNAVTNFSLILPRGRGWSSPNPLTTLAASGRMGWAQGGYNSILPKNIPQPSYQSLILPNSNQNPSRHLILPNSYVPPIPQVPQPSISFKIPNTTVGGVNPQLPPFLPDGIPQVPQSTIENGVKKNSQSFVRLGIMLGKYVGKGFVAGLTFLEDRNIVQNFIKVMDGIKSAVEDGDITSTAENFKNKLSRGFSKSLNLVPGFKEAKERFKGYLDFLKEIANPNVSAALGEGLANGIVAAKELFVDFLKMPEKIKEGFIQAKVAFDSFVEGMSKVQKFGEIMDFLKSSIGDVVKVLALLAVGKIILDLAPASIEVAANFENLERRIKFTSGSISEGAKNIAFLRSEAKRLNVDLSQTLESGSKFFQATKDTPIEGYQSRQIVSAVTQASAVYGLDLDKQQRTFTALEQMSGKTVVSQEELRQQLAEAIPNASQIAANAYGTTTQSMNQLLSTGRVLAEDFLPKFAQQLKAQTSSGVGDAVNSSVAITNKFNNSLTELQESIGKTLLPFRNFSLSVFASGIDLVTKNFQLLKSVLLITLIKLGSPVWLMFATYLKGISSSAGGAKGALLGMGQGIAMMGAQVLALSVAIAALDQIMKLFKDNSGAIGEQTRNVAQSIAAQRKLINPQSNKEIDFTDREAFGKRFVDRADLMLEMRDSKKQTIVGQQNTFDLLADVNSPAIKNAIQDIQFLDKSLDNIKMERRAIIANDPGNSKALRSLQEWEKRISGVREKPLELFGGTKANLDKQVETLKTYLEYWEELKKNPNLYEEEIDDINQIIKVTEQDLAAVIQEQDKMTKAIKNSLTEMQKFAIEIRNLEAKFNDLRQYRDTALSLEKTNLFNLGSSGDVLPGQLEYTNNLKTQATLTGKIADNLKQIQEMSAQLEVNDLDRVLGTLNLNKGSGIDTLKAAQERSIDGSKEKEILSGFLKVKEMQIQTVDMQQQIAEQKYNLIQSLYQQTKQVTDYYRAAVRESQAVGLEFEKAQKTFENSKVQNKLREALIGAGDNIYTQFIEGIINVISQTTEIEKQQLEARKQRIDYQNNVQDIQLQAIELQRSLPGKIIPIDSSIADNFNLSLKNVNRTVDEINKNINNLSNSVVDATKKAEDSIKGLSKTSNSWIEGLGTKFADLVKSFENGFDRVGTAIADMGIKTSNWLASLATGQGLLQNLAGGVQSAVSTVFGEKAGQQLEQGAKEFVSNPIGALKQFYGVDNNSTPSTRLKAKGKVGFVENSSSSIDSARGHIGDDIFAPIGSKIFSPLAGTVVQSRVGGTKNTDDANPLVPGYQPQQLVIIKLDMPIEFEGKKITHLNMRHLLDRNVEVGQKVKTGDLLGTVGEAGGRGTQFGTRNPGTARDADAAHLHIEYAPSENNQRNSLPDSQASRLTAKLSKEYSGGVQNTVNTPKTSRNRQPVPKVPLVPGLDPRIDTKFLQSVAKIAQSAGANPEDLLKTMLYETGGTLSPSARNKRTNATGLIQFMPATARGLGTNIDALSQMSPQEQLVFVQKYLKQNSRGQKLDSFRKVLSTVFAGNPNASLGVGDGDITLGNYLSKAENRYGNTARQLVQIVMQGGSIQPNQMQQAVTQASRLKLNTAAQQYQTNQINSNLNPEQIKENELKQRLEAYRLIMSSQKGAIGDIGSTKDSTLGTRITVLKGLSPNMSNADMFSLQFNELRRKLEKDVELLEQIVRETDGAIAQKPDLQAAFNLAMKRFPNDPRLGAAAIQTNDLSFKATAFKNAEAKNSLKFLKSNIDSILKASMKDFDKKEFFRLSEQDISQQSKVIEQLQQQLQLVQKLEEIDPLNPLVLKIPSLQRNISLLELTRDQYQQLLDLQRRYYDGGGKGGNMSEAAFQKEFKAILNVNSVKREGVDLNFNYADTVKRIKQANDELTKSQTIQASQMKSLQLDNERFAIDNKDGMVSLVSLTNELTIKTNELTNAYKKQLLEIQGNTLLSPQEKLIERLKAFRNYGKEKSNLDAENSYQTKLAPITNRGIELGRMEKLNSSGSAISSEIIRGRGLFGVRDKELQKAQLLSQIKIEFEKEKNEIAKLGLSSNYSAEEISVLSENLLKLNELKLDNVAKEFNMFTEAISGIKGDFDNILKGFFMNDSVNKNAGDLQDINRSLDEIAKKRRDIIMNTSGNIQEVRNAYQNSGNNKQLKELDRAQRDLEKKKTELSKRSIVDAFSEIAKSILSNLAAVASKELSNQLFGKLTEIIFGNKAKDVGAIALNNAGANLSMSATMLQQAALALQNIMGAGSKDGGVLDSIFGAFGESSFGILEGSSAIPFSSSGAFDFSSGFDLGGGLDFGSATLPSFAKGGMVGDLLNKERAISGFNPRLIIANEGERVLTPKETKLWNQLNSSNKLESFSSGGMIGESLGNINNVGRSGDTINITPNVNINNSEGGNGNINKALFEKALEAKIQETIKQERRPGGSLNRGGLYDR